MPDPTLLDLIPPSRVRVRLPFTGAFRKVEAEHAAAWLVFFTREHTLHAWEPVPVERLVAWLKECALRPTLRPYLTNPFVDLGAGFRTLKDRGWVRGEDRIEVTGEFVLRCFLAGHDLIAPLRWVARAMSATPEFTRAHLLGPAS